MTKSNVTFGLGEIVFEGLHIAVEEVFADYQAPEPIDIGKKCARILNSAKEATFECEMPADREWTLVYCRNCRQPIPITKTNALIYGRDGWMCPLCTTIVRRRNNEGIQ